MKIVFLSPTGRTGGAEAALHDLLAGLRDSHPTWSLEVVVASEGPFVARLAELGIPVHILPFPLSLARLGDWGLGPGLASRIAFALRCCAAAWPTFQYLLRLRTLLYEQAPDVIHSNGLKMHVLGAWARPHGTSVLWHVHDYLGRRPLMSRILRRCAHRCSAIIANSRSVAEDAQQVCGDRVQVHAVWNAVDLERFSPSGPRADLDALAGLPAAGEGVVRVGLVATFARWKGHATFLRALSMLPTSLPIRGYVVGGPLYETTGSQVSLNELSEQAGALGLGSRIGFTGFVNDSAAAMRALDIVVHASTDPEPFGLVIAEAMACGRAVVASRAGGASELTNCGVNALGHSPGDATAMARRIEELVSDPLLRERLGQRGRATAEQCFTRHRMAVELGPIYQSLAHVH